MIPTTPLPVPNPFALSDTALAVLAILTAFTVFATAVLTLYLTYKSHKEVKQVHHLVNSRMTQKLNRIEQLTEALVKSNTTVPADPNEPDPS